MVYRVVHYLNQFFGGMGGEERADTPVTVKEGAVGPGLFFDKSVQPWRSYAARGVKGGQKVLLDKKMGMDYKKRYWVPHNGTINGNE